MTEDDSLEAADRRILERTRKECSEELRLLERGLTVHMHALGFLGENGRWETNSDLLRVVLLTRCFNSLHVAYRALATGYHVQSLLILRSAIEDWVAERYVRAKPEEAPRWIDPNQHTPKRATLLGAVEAPNQDKVRKVFRTLDDFVHPGKLGIWQIAEPRTGGAYLRLGGHLDIPYLELVVYPFLFILSLLHHSLVSLHQDLGLQPDQGWVQQANAFDSDGTEWLRAYNQRLGEQETESRTVAD